MSACIHGCLFWFMLYGQRREIGSKEEIFLIQYYPVLTYLIIGHDPIKRINAMSSVCDLTLKHRRQVTRSRAVPILATATTTVWSRLVLAAVKVGAVSSFLDLVADLWVLTVPTKLSNVNK